MTPAGLSIALVALLHVIFMLLEMVFWTRPLGRRIFGLDREQARVTAVLAANQGLYNGFLAAGLAWGGLRLAQDPGIAVFFLACALLAGIYGGITASRAILLVQALPAALSLGFVYLA